MTSRLPGAVFAPFDLAWAIGRLSDRLPRAIAPREAVEATEAFARRLPPIFHWAVLETRLVGDRDRVDLLPAVVRTGREQDEVGAHLTSPDLDPALRTCLPILQRWASGEASLWPAHVLWFEWDAPFTQTEPLILPSIEPTFWGPENTPPPDTTAQVRLAQIAYEAAHGVPMPSPFVAGLTGCIHALPAEATAMAVTRTHARGVDAYRLFAAVPQQQVRGWLERIEWPGDMDAMTSWLDITVPWWEPAFLQVQMDAEGHTTSYLGIEPRQSPTNTLESRFRHGLLQHLVAQGLTDADTVQRVLDWPAEGLVARDGVTLRELTTLHLKVVLRADRPVEVKAYFGFHYEH